MHDYIMCRGHNVQPYTTCSSRKACLRCRAVPKTNQSYFGSMPPLDSHRGPGGAFTCRFYQAILPGDTLRLEPILEPMTEAARNNIAHKLCDKTKVQDEPLTDFPSGAKRSDATGKGRYDLISPYGLRELALVYEEGAKQKGDRNWENGFPMSRALDSALRHIEQYKAGCRDERHLGQAAWQLFAVIHFRELLKVGALDDSVDDLPNYNAPLQRGACKQ